MGPILWISLAILVAVLVVGVIAVKMAAKKRREGVIREVNYKAFYTMGLAFIPIGLVAMITIGLVTDLPFVIGLPLFTLGAVYLGIGLSNKSKWQKTD